MTYGFARQSGGQVRIYSEIGRGATVRLYLPRHVGDAETISAPPDMTVLAQASDGETVLVIDDEPLVRMLVSDVLKERGYAVIEAADGRAGLKLAGSVPRIDLLVTDIGLPGGLDGRQVADAARTLRPDLKVLFITGFAENAVFKHGHADAAMSVLSKPFAIEALASRVRVLLG